jgi:hypothetical protein
MHEEHQTEKDARGADQDCAGQRNRFFRGKQMKAEEYTLEQRYGIERRRLLNRAVVGWGVVQGLGLRLERRHAPDDREGGKASDEGSEPEKSEQGATDEKGEKGQKSGQRSDGRLRVCRGLALDRHGREIALPEAAIVSSHNTFARTRGEHDHQLKPAHSLPAGRYLLSVHYAERRFGDANLSDDCGCGRAEKNFVCETAVFSLSPLCGDPPCPCTEARCEREHHCGACDACATAGRGPHSQLCRWVEAADVAGEPPSLCRWQDYWVSPSDAVPLACVTICETDDGCEPLAFRCVDDECGPRRLVKNNDLLYDLVRGCDLTRISEISWQHWHRSDSPVGWKAFADFFEGDGKTGFYVSFSHPVLTSTLRRDSIVITAFTREQSTGWILARRIPTMVQSAPTEKCHLPEGTTDRARVYVSKRWYRDEIDAGRSSWLSDTEFFVEIEVRGDLILDCNHQAVDANAHGLPGIPSGNGSPGGTFLSSFRVQQKPTKHEET